MQTLYRLYKILAKISRISSFGIEVLIPKSVFEELDILKIDAKIEFSVSGNHIDIDSLDTYEHCTSNNSVSFIFLFNTVPIYTMPFLLEIALKLIQVKRSFGVDNSLLNIIAVSKKMLKLEASYKNRVIIPG